MPSRLNIRSFSESSSVGFQLKIRTRIAYSLGHMYNDLVACMWFSYLIVFFNYVLRFENSFVGYLLLIGQIVDAVATPFIGIAMDQSRGILGYGRTKSWHLIGKSLNSRMIINDKMLF